MLRWRFPKTGREAITASAIGLAALSVVTLIKGYTFLGDHELGLRDRAYLTAADTQASRVSPPFLLLNVSQKDQYRLGYPAVTPRDLLAKLMMLAAAGNPKLIVMDSDLGWSDGTDREAKLYDALATIAAKGRPVVLLVRAPFGRTDGPPAEMADAGRPDVLRPTPYDALVARSPNLIWVSALAPIDGDGITRRYLIGTRVCRAGKSLLLPSAQLTGCVALTNARRLPALRAVDPEEACLADGAPPPRRDPTQTFECAGHDWSIGLEGASADVAYRMRWELPVGTPRPQQLAQGSDIPVEEVEIVDALDLAEHADAVDAQAQFSGRVVIIGSSADVAGDRHRTSLGDMPGMLVIANAIRSALELGPRARASIWLSITATILMSLITYFSWAAIQRIKGIQQFVVKEAAAPALNLFWIFAITVLMPSEHVVDLLAPQFAVTLYLVVIGSMAELRERNAASAEIEPSPTEETI